MRTFLICLVAFPMIIYSQGTVYINVIAPSSAAGVEGNSSQIPLDTGTFAARFQQVYSSSIFAGFSQKVSIGEIAFRGDAFVGHPFDTTLSGVEIHLSTTSRAVDSLSPVFDTNVGADDQMVVGGSPFQIRGFGGGGVYGTWSVGLDLRSNPFLYNPASGNLLLDIKVFNGASTSPLDAVDAAGDTVSSVFRFGSSIPSSGTTSSAGLATFFAVQDVPEPSTMALLVFWGVVMALAARKNIQRKAKNR